jgi:hypothetical protein
MFNETEKQDIWFKQAELYQRIMERSCDKDLARSTLDRMIVSILQYKSEDRVMDYPRMDKILETSREMFYEKFKIKL